MMLETWLEQMVRKERTRRWQEENREAIEAHNRFVEEHGIFSERLRRFSIVQLEVHRSPVEPLPRTCVTWRISGRSWRCLPTGATTALLLRSPC